MCGQRDLQDRQPRRGVHNVVFVSCDRASPPMAKWIIELTLAFSLQSELLFKL